MNQSKTKLVQAKLNHIGIAVSDLSQIVNLFDELGLSVNHSELVEDQGVKTHFIPLPSATTQLELLESVDPNGPVSKFLSKRGPGIHHLSFELEKGSLEDVCARLRAKGVELTSSELKQGAHGMRINFIHPSSAGGVLIELMEAI